MTNVFSGEGILCVLLLFCASCGYFRRVPRIKQYMENRKKGFFGIFFKGSVIGIRLHYLVSLLMSIMSLYILFVK